MKASAALLGLALLVQAPIERRPPATHNPQPNSQPPEADQETAQSIPTLTVGTRLVSVPVNVVDEHGAPVPDLTAEDFAIAEDGKPQKLAIFERETLAPLSIVLAIDTSESVLRDENLEKAAAKHFLKALVRPQDEVDLMEFSEVVRELVPFTNNTKRIEDGFSQIRRGSATALYDAIYLASQRLAESHPAAHADDAAIRRRVVVLITDGGDTVKGSRYMQALEQAQRAGAMVYSLIIVPVAADAGRDTGGEHALIQMADDTGGKYYYVERPKDLDPALRHVSDDLRTQYLLGYYAPERRHADDLRTIKVTLTNPALAAKDDLRYRKAYYGDTQ